MYGFKILNWINLDYFLKFIVHELNSKIIKSVMMMLTEIKKLMLMDCSLKVIYSLLLEL
jgi:hypothetical protein